VARQNEADLQAIVRSAVTDGGVESAAVFVLRPGSPALELAAAAGIEGPALDRLISAVQDPAHPITRTLADDGPTFDVKPMNPGGPALRSHLPVVAVRDGRQTTVGVLAVAHEHSLSAHARETLQELANAAGASIERAGGPATG
jgi:hypothetical protein